MLCKKNTPLMLVGVQTGTATLEINMAVSQKIGTQPTSRPSNTALGHIPKGYTLIPQRHLLNYIHSSIFHKNLKTTLVCLKRRLDKENVSHLHNRVLFSGREKVNNDILKSTGKWMELEKTILSDITQTQKDKYCMYS